MGGFASGGRPWLHNPTSEEPSESGNDSADHESMQIVRRLKDEISRVSDCGCVLLGMGLNKILLQDAGRVSKQARQPLFNQGR